MDFIEGQIENLFKKHYLLKEDIDNDKDNIANDICGIHKRLIELQNDIKVINDKQW